MSLFCFSDPEGDGIAGNKGALCETPTASESLTGTVDAWERKLDSAKFVCGSSESLVGNSRMI